MIGYIAGEVMRNNGKTILVTVGGIGYEITVPLQTITNCVIGEKIQLYTYLHVREDELSLYGFENEDDLSFFKQVLTVSGVGPRMGIEILSLPSSRVKQAIVEEDISYLKTISGVGEKLASRIVLELKKKIRIDPGTTLSQQGSVNMDVVAVLEKLGYDSARVIKLLKNMENPIENEEELIKYCLRHL